MSSGPLLLLFPPGWCLDVGGPYLALPQIRSYLENRGVPVEIIDLNIDAASFYGACVSEEEVLDACALPTIERLNRPYFRARDTLRLGAGPQEGVWDIRKGFQAPGFTCASSEVVRSFSMEATPFTCYYREVVLPRVKHLCPNIIGLSLAVPEQLLPALELCRLLRREGYSGYIVLGGNVVTRLGCDMYLDWLFDIVDGLVPFQGEYALYDLWHALNDRSDLTCIRNLVWRRRKGEFVTNRIELLKVGDFCGPSFEGLELSSYWGTSYLPIVGSRGCYFGRCTFCSIPFAWGQGGFLGTAQPQLVSRDIIALVKRWGITRFKFVDEALHPRFLQGLSEYILADEICVAFEGYARLEVAWLDSQIIRTAARAGLKKLYLGLELLEAGSRETLGKRDAAARTLDILTALSDEGVKAHVFCMVGFPGTGIGEALDTLDFALRHSRLIDTLDIFPFEYARHTSIDNVTLIRDASKDWALAFEYRGDSAAGVLQPEEVTLLARELEDVVWRERPEWLHPIYRLRFPGA